MRPYLIEGLDCSGKKTIARQVTKLLAERGVAVDLVIGPLVQGPLGRLDGYLANITSPVSATSALGRFRRLSYVAGPVIDGSVYRPTRGRRAVKVSSHYRAWARAQAEGDQLMDRAFTTTRSLHVRYAGATLLSTDFDVRLQRHRADVAAGRTSKNEQRRFFGPDQAQFQAWHTALDALLEQNVGRLQRLDSGADDASQLAEEIVMHMTSLG